MSHADILDIDRGHIFRKHKHKNNKKVVVIYEKTEKIRPLQGICPPVAMGRVHSKCDFPRELCVRAHI